MATGKTRRQASAALIGTAVLAGALTACGAASAGAPGSSQPPAASFAAKILNSLRLPHGARVTTSAELPGSARNPWTGAAGAADTSRTFTIPASAAATQTYLMTHRPAGTDITGSGTEQDPHGTATESVYYHIGSVPDGISGADVQVFLIARGSAATVAAAYVHVTGKPARTTAEHLTASAVKAVQITVNGKATSTFTSGNDIARLAGTVNALPPAGNRGAASCPGGTTDYKVAFLPRAGNQPPVTIEAYSCDYVNVVADSVPQPALSDPTNTVAALAASLTHTRQYAS
jgi:hypothetical protein